MDWKGQLQDLWNRLTWTGTAPFTLPGVLFEIQPDFVLGARLGGSRSNGTEHAQFGRLALQPLEPGALAPALSGPSVLEERKLAAVLEQVAQMIGNGQSDSGILVPDGVVRVAILPFEALPDSRREAVTLMGWRMRDGLPFPPEQARISFESAELEDGQREVVTLAARASVLAEYEALLDTINRSSTLILPATIALLPLLPQDAKGGQLLVHVYSSAATLAVIEGQRLRLWRAREFEGLAPDEFLAQLAAEAGRVLASAEDRLKLRLDRIWLCARPPATTEWVAPLAQALNREVDLLTPAPELASLLTGQEHSLFSRYGAPLAGLVANA
jgi:hypothetical protein